uniref:Pheromone-binding protein-related protein 2 n=1 Tax=Lygus hesperus TaxID=30085 RepID=A0A146MC78_LYGHE
MTQWKTACLFVVMAALTVITFAGLPFQNEMAVMQCKLKFDVTAEDVQLLKDRKLPASHSGKCMMACILKKMKVMTKRGQFDLRNVQKWLRNKYQGDQVNLAKGNYVAEACANTLPTLGVQDECEMAAEIMTCVRNKSKLVKKTADGKLPEI